MVEEFNRLSFADQLKLCGKMLLNHQKNENFLNKKLPEKVDQLSDYLGFVFGTNDKNLFDMLDLKYRSQKNVEQFKQFYNENQKFVEGLREAILSGHDAEEKLNKHIDEEIIPSIAMQKEPRLQQSLRGFQSYLNELVISDAEIERSEFANTIKEKVGENFDLSKLNGEKKCELQMKADEYFSQFNEKEIKFNEKEIKNEIAAIKMKDYLKNHAVEVNENIFNKLKDIQMNKIEKSDIDNFKMKEYIQKFAIGNEKLQELKSHKETEVAKANIEMQNWQNRILIDNPQKSGGLSH